MSTPKRHHYVPQFYLKGFADEQERIWVYDRVNKAYRHQKVDQVALISNYYRIEKKDGTQSPEIEELLSDIEGNASTPIYKLIHGEPISDKEKTDVALFVAIQMTRVPDHEKETNEAQEKLIRMMNKQRFPSVEATKERIEELSKDYKDIGKGVDPAELFELMQEDKYKIEIPRQNNIRSMLELAVHVVPYFMQMDWMIVIAPKDGAFITSDNPFTLVPTITSDSNTFFGRGLGILTPGAQKAIPLSPNVSLVICDPGERFGKIVLSRTRIRQYNIFYARTSDRFIFAKNETHLRTLVERSKVDDIPIDRDRVSFQ